jgi:RHS repeat-associated protein
MRAGSTLSWLFGDHLGSQSITVNGANGSKTGEIRFKAWGEDRYTWGSTPTSYRYTGQRAELSLSIYFYGARWYDPYLNRWASPDSIVPEKIQGVQAWDRYAYANNNPLLSS